MKEIHYRVLKRLDENPHLTQRQLASEMGISLGKVNYCLKALLDKGWIKASNFKNSNNKAGYIYLLTPKGLEAKAKLTASFLRRKMQEYETLKKEIAELKRTVKSTDLGGGNKKA